MTNRTTILRYAAFAIIATAANLLAQRFVLVFDSGAIGLMVALAVGTLVGLGIKYYLDKRWIFYDNTTGLQPQSRQFALYSMMGIATTLIFWGAETVFWAIWKTDLMRELGAIIGLSIGYVVKFILDQKYVFTAQPTEVVK